MKTPLSIKTRNYSVSSVGGGPQMSTPMTARLIPAPLQNPERRGQTAGQMTGCSHRTDPLFAAEMGRSLGALADWGRWLTGGAGLQGLADDEMVVGLLSL